MVQPLIHSHTSPDSIALTFDDGPSEWTPATLEALDTAGALATFFVTAGSEPGLVARIAASGHEIAYHCGTHVRHTDRTFEEVRREAEADLEWLAMLGIEPRRWRPPWGTLAPWSAELADELGMETWLWTDDTHDWDGRPTQRMLEDLDGTLAPGAVVLMHDAVGPGARRDDTLSTVALIAPLVVLVRDRGLEPGLLDAPKVAHA